MQLPALTEQRNTVSVSQKHLLSFIMGFRRLPLIMLHKAFPFDTQEYLENGKEGLFLINRPRSNFSNSPRASLVHATTVETNTQGSRSPVMCIAFSREADATALILTPLY